MSTMRKHLGFVAAVALFTGSAASHAGDDNFRARSLRGAWGFTASGTLFVTTSPTPAVAVGRSTFDGLSSCTSQAKLNAGGTLVEVAATSCSYTVNADGTGTQLTEFPGLGRFRTDFVIVDNAKEFRFIISDQAQPGTTVASGVAKRQ